MKRRNIVIMILFLFSACADAQIGGDSGNVTLPEIDISTSSNGVVPLPNNTPKVFTNWFSKYTKTYAPNGKPIHFLAQSGWTELQIVKARNVMEHILNDFPGSEYGNDKSIVANAMSDRKATMVLFNTPGDMQQAMRGDLGSATDLNMQDLRANENPAEGTEDYMAHRTRDASYEEILHLIHDYGIKPALPEYQAEIVAHHEDMEARDLWTSWGDANEYIAVIYDHYLDLWNPYPTVYEGNSINMDEVVEGTSHFGAYRAGNSRTTLKNNDPVGYELVVKFFHPYLTYTPQLPESFEGTFSIEFDVSVRYTYKSQHLTNVTLTGSNNANLDGNGHDNTLTGNDGMNTIRGNSGDDQIDGGNSSDTAVYSGVFAEYSLKDGENTVVHDSISERDGTDTLMNIEILQFSDRKVEL